MSWDPPYETTLHDEQVRIQECSLDGHKLRRIEHMHPLKEDMLAWKLKKLGYHMDTDTQTITIPHRTIPDWFTWGIVWLLNAYWIGYVLLGIVVTWMGYPALLIPLFWSTVLKLCLPIASFTSLPGLLLGYTQIVVVVHDENEKDEQKLATIHIRHYHRWAYTPLIWFLSLLPGTAGKEFLKDRTISVPFRGDHSCDNKNKKSVQLVGHEYQQGQPSSPRLSWIYQISLVNQDEEDENETEDVPVPLLDNVFRINIGKHIQRQKKLGKMVVSSLLGLRGEKIQVQRGLYLTQVLNMWCHADYDAEDHPPSEEEEAMMPMMTNTATTSPSSSSSLRSRVNPSVDLEVV